MLTGQRNLDFIILRNLDDRSLFLICKSEDPYINSLCTTTLWQGKNIWQIKILDKFSHLSARPNSEGNVILDELAANYDNDLDMNDPQYWYKLYVRLSNLPPNLTLAFIKLLINPANRDIVLGNIIQSYDKKVRDFSARTGYDPQNGQFSMMNPAITDRFRELNNLIVLRPEISSLLNEHILPTFANDLLLPLSTIKNNLAIYSHGITSKEVLFWILREYTLHRIRERVIPPYGSEDMMTDDELHFIVDDAAIPDSKLDAYTKQLITITPDIVQRITAELDLLAAAAARNDRDE